MKNGIIIIIISLILLVILVTILFIQLGKSTTDPTVKAFPESSTNSDDMQNWKWNTKCRGKVDFITKSEWPTFLSQEAWNDGCQGCKSVPDTNPNFNDAQQNNSKDSFQIVGDWMRISQRNSGSFSNVSTANSKKHWFNPPRNNTNDKPLEMEWYMYMDASTWGNTVDEVAESGIAKANWSAFWTFGHGMPLDPTNLTENNYGWPYGGEWDLAESLPVFSNSNNLTDITRAPSGISTGFHNGSSGAFPPCCLKRDGIMYPKPVAGGSIPINAISAVTGKYGLASKVFIDNQDWEGLNKYLVENNDDIYYYAGAGDPTARSFLTWGQALFKNKYGRLPDVYAAPVNVNNPTKKEMKIIDENNLASALTLNNLLHIYMRVTTKSALIWVRQNADPSSPPALNIKPNMTQEEVGMILEKAGFVSVFSSYADFGSNNDTTFSDQFDKPLGQAGMTAFVNGKPVQLPIKGVNWHQNMMCVWSVITQMNNAGRFTNTGNATEMSNFWKHLTSYMSDISIRGGGNYTKAMAPPGITDPNMIKYITEGTDDTSYTAYKNKNLANWDNSMDPSVLDCRNILSR